MVPTKAATLHTNEMPPVSLLFRFYVESEKPFTLQRHKSRLGGQGLKESAF